MHACIAEPLRPWIHQLWSLDAPLNKPLHACAIMYVFAAAGYCLIVCCGALDACTDVVVYAQCAYTKGTWGLSRAPNPTNCRSKG